MRVKGKERKGKQAIKLQAVYSIYSNLEGRED